MGGGHFQEFEDEYLETLYHFHELKPGERVRNGDLANYLNISPASATEMVQRLARNGFVDYVAYKGVLLTEKGLEHGQMMKRRHRLAEVLLSALPFDGDIHETACRLEHAFDDDLEVCISLLLGNPILDPSGKNIPQPSERIAKRLDKSSNDMCKMNKLSSGNSGKILLIIHTSESRKVLQSIGLEIGSFIERKDDDYYCNGNLISIDENLSNQIVLRC
ncbi:MAG: metal-dependent transcriptional regulator [Candidatus Poseidoniaceae archaeon]|jgi:DtxR family Mn-dependent transcriptional regulator|nr:metal-dependent transcriptional regulator [Candidatus Poseidoniaceae archaeon]